MAPKCSLYFPTIEKAVKIHLHKLRNHEFKKTASRFRFAEIAHTRGSMSALNLPSHRPNKQKSLANATRI